MPRTNFVAQEPKPLELIALFASLPFRARTPEEFLPEAGAGRVGPHFCRGSHPPTLEVGDLQLKSKDWLTPLLPFLREVRSTRRDVNTKIDVAERVEYDLLLPGC